MDTDQTGNELRAMSDAEIEAVAGGTFMAIDLPNLGFSIWATETAHGIRNDCIIC
jgi:hypothetical protein